MGNRAEVYFEVLNVPKDASPRDIRAAYRALVKRWHPDMHPPSSRPEAEAKFKVISQAYEALNDQQENGELTPPRQRRQEGNELRDEDGSVKIRVAAVVAVARPARTAFSSLSGALRTKPPPMETKLECTLEELCRGSKKEIKIARNVIAANGAIVRKEETRTIRLKPGWKKGTKITLQGMGDEQLGRLPADVVVTISEQEHPIFKRVGDDLVLKVEISLVNALTGWSFSFRLLTGEKMRCCFQDEIISPGYEKVIKGQGMPSAHGKGERGDLRIKFLIVFPTRLSDEQRSSIVQILKDCT